MKKTKKPPKTAQRAYAIASFIVTALREVDESDMSTALAKVHLQAVRAMRVFAAKSDKEWFLEFIDGLGEMWEEVGSKYGIGVKIENAHILVEALQHIVPDSEFKTFFATKKYELPEPCDDEDCKKALLIAIGLNDKLCEATGTRPASEILPKPKKKKEKKPREKSKKQKLHEKREAEARARKEERRRKLREIVANAKRKAEEMQQEA